jgi:hypothetical protein
VWPFRRSSKVARRATIDDERGYPLEAAIFRPESRKAIVKRESFLCRVEGQGLLTDKG